MKNLPTGTQSFEDLRFGHGVHNSIILRYPFFSFDRKDKMVYVYHDDRQMKVSNTEIFAKANYSNNDYGTLS
jgi:hypothetical protein